MSEPVVTLDDAIDRLRWEGKQEMFYSDPWQKPLSHEQHRMLTLARQSGAQAAALVRAAALVVEAAREVAPYFPEAVNLRAALATFNAIARGEQTHD